MKARYLLILVPALHAGLAVAENSASGPLTVAAEIPVVSVIHHPPGRYFLTLPTLEYAFDVGAQCNGNATPESLSINVADSRLTLSAAELGGNGQQRVVLEIPARQIAPIAIDNFCVIDINDAVAVIEPAGSPVAVIPGPLQITVDAALSAQVSLLCSNESEREITYVAQPLDVNLSCAASALNSTDPETQETDRESAPD